MNIGFVHIEEVLRWVYLELLALCLLILLYR